MTTTRNTQTALEAYEASQEQIKYYLAKIETGLLNHDRKCSENPGGHTWAAQGDLSHVAHQLHEISDFLNSEGEYNPIINTLKTYRILNGKGQSIKVTVPEK